jgi:hypothetical protein
MKSHRQPTRIVLIGTISLMYEEFNKKREKAFRREETKGRSVQAG